MVTMGHERTTEHDSRPLRSAARRTGYSMRKQSVIDWRDLCTLVAAALDGKKRDDWKGQQGETNQQRDDWKCQQYEEHPQLDDWKSQQWDYWKYQQWDDWKYQRDDWKRQQRKGWKHQQWGDWKRQQHEDGWKHDCDDDGGEAHPDVESVPGQGRPHPPKEDEAGLSKMRREAEVFVPMSQKDRHEMNREAAVFVPASWQGGLVAGDGGEHLGGLLRFMDYEGLPPRGQPAAEPGRQAESEGQDEAAQPGGEALDAATVAPDPASDTITNTDEDEAEQSGYSEQSGDSESEHEEQDEAEQAKPGAHEAEQSTASLTSKTEQLVAEIATNEHGNPTTVASCRFFASPGGCKHGDGYFFRHESRDEFDPEVLGAAVHPQRHCVPAVIPTGQGRPQPQAGDEAGLSNSAGLLSAVGAANPDAGLRRQGWGGPADVERESKEVAAGTVAEGEKEAWGPKSVEADDGRGASVNKQQLEGTFGSQCEQQAAVAEAEDDGLLDGADGSDSQPTEGHGKGKVSHVLAAPSQGDDLTEAADGTKARVTEDRDLLDGEVSATADGGELERPNCGCCGQAMQADDDMLDGDFCDMCGDELFAGAPAWYCESCEIAVCRQCGAHGVQPEGNGERGESSEHDEAHFDSGSEDSDEVQSVFTAADIQAFVQRGWR